MRHLQIKTAIYSFIFIKEIIYTYIHKQTNKKPNVCMHVQGKIYKGKSLTYIYNGHHGLNLI